MNLSKTFDTLNRKVLLAKLNAYAFSENNIVIEHLGATSLELRFIQWDRD